MCVVDPNKYIEITHTFVKGTEREVERCSATPFALAKSLKFRRVVFEFHRLPVGGRWCFDLCRNSGRLLRRCWT
ncbi:hypothetical protein HanIR_Chr15g0738831 [Helianthus annuus]|nr:hypothetical protein HanIR_Chr15g0738831 [Helianthus annuus]